MSLTNIDPFDFTPPPAYNDSQEFDRKVSLATEISLITPPAPAPELSEERWAEIEEAAFQAAIAASLSELGDKNEQDAGRSNNVAAGPSSPPASPTLPTLPVTQPLRIEKRSNQPVPLKRAKSRPNWLADAEGTSRPSRVTPSPSSSSAYDGDDIAPPPFVATTLNRTAPSIHGHTNYASPTPSTTLPNPDHLLPSLDALSISAAISEQESYPDSRPRTPVRRLPQPGAPVETKSVEASFGYYRQSMPVSPAQPAETNRTDQRPRSELSPTHVAPMVQFNPSVAYGKAAYRPPPNPPKSPDAHSHSSFDSKPEVFRANAFYNAAVSGHISTPQRPSNQRAPSYPNIPSSPSPYQTSYSNTSSPQTTYRSFDNSGGMLSSTTYHQGSPMEQHPWQPTYNPNSNRPMSILSVDTVYSNNGISQHQYLNAVNRIPQQHSGPQGWMQPGGQFQGHYR